MDGCANGSTTMGLNVRLHTGNFLLKCRTPLSFLVTGGDKAELWASCSSPADAWAGVGQ